MAKTVVKKKSLVSKAPKKATKATVKKKISSVKKKT